MFIAGRDIGLHESKEKKGTDGLFFLIDFKKAFVSVSWKFINAVLNLLGFRYGFMEWIKFLNSNVIVLVMQYAMLILSDPFPILCGC